MINILMPIAGKAKRFLDCGWSLPKPLIPAAGIPMIQLAVDSLIHGGGNIPTSVYRLIFVVRDDHCTNYDITGALEHLFDGWALKFATVTQVTQGTLCSCLTARHLIDPDEPLIVYTPDVAFDVDFDIHDDFVMNNDLDGILLTFKANSPDHSYVATTEAGLATRTVEKSVISNDALVGVYGFKTGAMFLDCAQRALDDQLTVNGEYYVAPIFNYLISAGKHIGTKRVDKMHVLGTPEDLTFYETHVARYDDVPKFAICCDHSGFNLKEQLCGILHGAELDFVDFGVYSGKDSDHYDSLKPCVTYLLANAQALGIAVCHTGQGFNIAANKVKGIRSALIHDDFTAAMARRHNAANFFCLPSRHELNLEGIIRSLINNSFDGGRHATRIRRITSDPLFSS